MFGCLFSIFRSIASLILGLVIFFAFLGYLLIANVRDNFLTTEFYNESLSENNVYNRIYDEVLLDKEFEDTTSELLGDIDVAHEDIVDVAREIMPTEYLQEQVEGAVNAAIDYLNKKTDEPDLYLDLGPPLENVKPALFRYMDRRIDELQEDPVTTIEELEQALKSLFRTLESGDIPDRVPSIEDPEALVARYVDDSVAQIEEVQVRTPREFQRVLEGAYKELANGRIPTRIPSLDAIDPAVRIAVYDLVFQAVRNDPSIPREAIEGLEAQDEAIKAQLLEGTVKGVIKVATPELTGPVVEKFVDDAYDLAFESLQEEGFPQKALDGLDRRKDAVKEHLGEGRIKEALKVGARGLAEPLIDDAIAELREELDDQDRLDLIAKAAENNNQTKAEFLDKNVDRGADLLGYSFPGVRDIIARGKVGIWLTIVLMVAGVVLMSIVHLPHLASGLRYPGLTLLFSGLLFLIIGLVLSSQLPERFDDLINPTVEGTGTTIPPSLIEIISDVLITMGTDVASGFIAPSIAVLVIGAVLLISSFFIRLLHIPFLSR